MYYKNDIIINRDMSDDELLLKVAFVIDKSNLQNVIIETLEGSMEEWKLYF